MIHNLPILLPFIFVLLLHLSSTFLLIAYDFLSKCSFWFGFRKITGIFIDFFGSGTFRWLFACILMPSV